MRIITWNANGAYRKKFERLEALQPDIVIVQEAEPDFFEKRGLPYVWTGKDPKKKGIGVYAMNQHSTLERADIVESKHMMPIIYREHGMELHILAVWSQKDGGSDYIEGMNKDMPKYQGFLYHPNSFVIGDWNSSVALDEKYGGEEVGHNVLVRLLESWNLGSAYHYSQGMDAHGKEKHPTFFHRKEMDNPFHIDYFFAPKKLLPQIKEVSVGHPDEWIKLSDHMPLIVDIQLDSIQKNDEGIKWTFAKTYALSAPHEYVLQRNYPEYFAQMQAKIAKEGTDEPFTLFGNTKVYRYIYTESHRYWVDEDVLNRDSRYGRKVGSTKAV